jgi:hypothetical protein
MMPFMLTESKRVEMQSLEIVVTAVSENVPKETHIPDTDAPESNLLQISDLLPSTKSINPIINSVPEIAHTHNKDRPSREHKRGLFWSIYELENPSEAFLRTRANIEIETRIKIIDELKKNPKCLKYSNSKLTLEQTQGLYGSMLTAKEDRIDFCIAYAVYYKKPIIVVYQKSYRVFSPTVEIDLSEENIVLYASKPEGARSISYIPERSLRSIPDSKREEYELTPENYVRRSLTNEIIANIVNTKIEGPLKAMSTYKTAELDEIASKLQIPTKQTESGKEKRRKKEDIYNDIKLAIHNDMIMSRLPNE